MILNLKFNFFSRKNDDLINETTKNLKLKTYKEEFFSTIDRKLYNEKTCGLKIIENKELFRKEKIIIKPLLINDFEFMKTPSFTLEDINNKPIDFYIKNISNSDGFVIMEDLETRERIKIFGFNKEDFLHIPKGFGITIINNSENEYLILEIVREINTFYNFRIFRETFGPTLFFTKNGFLRNKNIEHLYDLEEYIGDEKNTIYYNEAKEFFDKF